MNISTMTSLDMMHPGALRVPADLGSLKGRRILWIEDDKFLIDIIKKKLSRTEAVLTHAADGEEALAALGEGVPDVIVVDLVLPGISGFEIIRRINADTALKSVPVVVLSNMSYPQDLEKARLLGVDLYIVKAMSGLDDILEKIASVRRLEA